MPPKRPHPALAFNSQLRFKRTRLASTLPQRVKRYFLAWRNTVLRRKRIEEDVRTRIALALPGPFPRRLYVQAPAGSGKTTLIFEMIAAAPDTSCLVITFNRDIADAMRAKAPANATVKTFDALCVAATGSAGSLADSTLVKAAYSKCDPWYKKKGGRGISAVAAAHLEGHKVELCSYHGLARYCLTKAEKIPSFARGRKWVEDNNTDVTKGFSRVFVDESQDMTPQAMAILTRSAAPMVVVGDMNQRIYAFSLESTCQQCSIAPRKFEPERDACQVKLYQTFRSPQSTISYMKDRCGVECVGPSRRRYGNITIKCKSLIDTLARLITPHTCVLARSNEEVVLVAAELICRGNSRIGVVGGTKIASEIETLAKIKNGRAHSPFHSWVRELDDTQVRTYASMLREWSAGLGDAHCIVSTIHRAKGSERKHTIVLSGYDTRPGSEFVREEREVWYVALTRHTSTCIELRA